VMKCMCVRSMTVAQGGTISVVYDAQLLDVLPLCRQQW
jgi:hypothetical protein